MRIFQALALIAMLAQPADAQELLLGAGFSDFSREEATDSVVLSGELRSASFATLLGGEVAAMAVLDAHAEGDGFAGIGLAARWSVGAGGWFVDAGVAPGVFNAGRSGNFLGRDLEFRTHLGVGRRMADGNAWSLAALHKSNADTGSVNPGMNSVLLRWHHGF